MRGIVGETITVETVTAVGAAFVDSLNLAGQTILVGGDMRPSSPEFCSAFAKGATRRGADVLLLDLISTDELYFASGMLNAAGVTFTASHNPAQYNGMKMTRPGAVPVSSETGLYEVQALAEQYLDRGFIPAVDKPGQIGVRDVLEEYSKFLRAQVDLSASRPLKVVVDAGNGMAGLTTPAVLGDKLLPALPLEIVPLYFELDGSFPNHEANPLDPANLVDLQDAIREQGADIGLAFDGDADRCFVVDENGDPVSPSAVTALVAARELAKHPGSTVIHNLITSHAVPEIIAENGGTAVRSRVGHSFIKAEMARTNAVFGGEHSAHYYFREFWFADTGMLAAMHVLAALGGQERPLSAYAAEYERYAASGEINSTVADAAAKVAEVRAAYPEATIDELDGLTVQLRDGAWFNLRASNTEPLLRLNVEAPKPDRMAALRDEVLSIVRR